MTLLDTLRHDLAHLNDEALVWIALALLPSAHPMSRTPLYPDGLGGFMDRERLERLRQTATEYVTALTKEG